MSNTNNLLKSGGIIDGYPLRPVKKPLDFSGAEYMLPTYRISPTLRILISCELQRMIILSFYTRCNVICLQTLLIIFHPEIISDATVNTIVLVFRDLLGRLHIFDMAS